MEEFLITKKIEIMEPPIRILAITSFWDGSGGVLEIKKIQIDNYDEFYKISKIIKKSFAICNLSQSVIFHCFSLEDPLIIHGRILIKPLITI